MTDSDPALHPRSQFRREWLSLEGPWEFAMESQGLWEQPRDVEWTRTIRVPFAPETAASGIGDTGFHEVCWYRRTIPRPALAPGRQLVLHFNAVDYAATVWVNGALALEHEGGYTPFSAVIDEFLDGDAITIVVRAEDDPFDLAKPRGKQDWQLEPHSIWYPRCSGIWQTPWLEIVPPTWIDGLRWTPNLERWELGLEAHVCGRRRDEARLRVRMFARDALIVDDRYQVVGGEVNRRIGLSDPGIDDYRNELLWSPHSPTLIDVVLELLGHDDTVLDRVDSYTALRAVGVEGHALLLNGRPFPLRFVLDQGYWPETGMTAPDTQALRQDVELAKAMGFNGVRKHQKVEDPRYLYWADRLGLLVWSEMPSAYRFTHRSIERVTRQWLEVLSRDVSHPCIVAWVPFNESWGVPNLPEIAAQRHYVQALYHLTKTFDPTRPVIGNDGWESATTDIVGIHDYDDDLERLRHRYLLEGAPHLFRRERPGGRALMLPGHAHTEQPLVLTEFGGIACSPDRGDTWGYSVAGGSEDLAARYTALLETIRSLPAFAGFCYTQFADTYQEANGLLDAQRRPKFPIEQIAEATRGPRVPRQAERPAPKNVEPATQHQPAAP